MKKSLGNKRNELSPEQIDEITKFYFAFKHDAKCEVMIEGKEVERICSKIFDNREFGFIKLTVERPLRLNFQGSTQRIQRLKGEGAFAALGESKKRKNRKDIIKEIEAGCALQEQIISALGKLDPDRLYRNRESFRADLDGVLERTDLDIPAPVYRSILAALSERDPTADICTDSKGDPEPDPELRDTESVPLPKKTSLPLPLKYKGADGKDPDNDELVELMRTHCDGYFAREVAPHWPDAWIDYSKTKVGYEISISRHFYVYEPSRPLDLIEIDIKRVEGEILTMLKEVA